MSNSQHHQIMKNPIITESVKTSNKPLNLGNVDFREGSSTRSVSIQIKSE